MFPKKEITLQNYFSAAYTLAQTINQKNYAVIKTIKSLVELKNS